MRCVHGSLRQRSTGSWELRVFVATDPDTGRRIDRTATVRGTRAHAEHELAEMVASVRSSRAVGVRSPRSELLEAWFAIAEMGWAPTTACQTRSVLNRYLHPHIGAVLVGDLTPAGIDGLYVRLRCSGGVGGKPLKPGTLARIHVVLRSSLAQAMRWGWIWDNPAERAHRIVQTPIEIRPPTPSELRVLLDHIAARDPMLHTFVTLAAITGARRAQVLAFRWGNVDLERARVSFRRGWVEGPNGPVLTATKGKRSHVVDLDPTTFAVVADLHQTLVAPPVDDDFLFTDDGGRTAWKPNRSPRTSSATGEPPGYARSGSTTSATSWPPKCSRPGSRSSSSPAASTTDESPPHSTAMRTPSREPTRTPAKPSRRSSRREVSRTR
jgi:integrase